MRTAEPWKDVADPKTYFRARCLACGGAALVGSHPKPDGDDCAGCHMLRRPAKDGGHTAFTDHSFPQPEGDTDRRQDLVAWHQPPEVFAKRNVGLAYIEAGRALQSARYMLQGYRILAARQPEFPNDPAVLTAIGLVLLETVLHKTGLTSP